MSNTNSPFGFRYFGRLEGGSPTEGLSYRQIASTYNTAIYTNDPVVSLNTGYIAAATVTTTQVSGILTSLEYLNTNISQNIFAKYWPGTTGVGGQGQAGLCTDPDAMFLVQSNGTAIAFGDIGANVGFVATAGSTLTGLSAYAIDQGTIATTSALPFRIVGLYSQYAPPGTPGTDDTSNYNWAVVTFNSVDRNVLPGI